MKFVCSRSGEQSGTESVIVVSARGGGCCWHCCWLQQGSVNTVLRWTRPHERHYDLPPEQQLPRPAGIRHFLAPLAALRFALPFEPLLSASIILSDITNHRHQQSTTKGRQQCSLVDPICSIE